MSVITSSLNTEFMEIIFTSNTNARQIANTTHSYPHLVRRTQDAISKSILGKRMSDGTYYLSCWMTMAQIEQMRTQKVMFKSFD